MAEEIKRVGPPKASDLKGEEFTWSVPLSQPPSRDWTRLFSEPAETSVMCHPKRIGMMHQALVFKCEEQHVVTWMEHIDKWIGGANAALAEQEEAEKRRRAEQLQHEEEKQRRIQEANEKVKGL